MVIASDWKIVLDNGMDLLDSGLSKSNQERITEGWEVVKLMVGRIRKMIEDILFYAKERDLKWERVDTLNFAREVAAVVEPKIKSQGSLFSVKIPKKPPASAKKTKDKSNVE